MLREQNLYSRTLSNDRKMGFYPTERSHCSAIGETLVFSEDEPTCCSEPCCGEGDAISALTGFNNKNIKWFCSELDPGRAETAKSRYPEIEELVCDDFLEGMIMTKSSFSFCFCNPPYQTDNLVEEGTERTEKQFLIKLTDYLTKGALLVWVVPYSSFTELSQFRYMAQRYDILKVWRFRPDEYAKFHQVAVIARKKEPKILLKDELDALRASFLDINNIEVLPEHPTERFEVYPSDPEKIKYFCARKFDENAALQLVVDLSNTSEFDDVNKAVNRKITTKQYSFGKAGRPPIPPKKDTLYLMATSGYGAGITGSVENGDLHLQRGVAEVVEDESYETDPSHPDKEIVRVTSRTQVTMTVVQNDGTITVLQ